MVDLTYYIPKIYNLLHDTWNETVNILKSHVLTLRRKKSSQVFMVIKEIKPPKTASAIWKHASCSLQLPILESDTLQTNCLPAAAQHQWLWQPNAEQHLMYTAYARLTLGPTWANARCSITIKWSFHKKMKCPRMPRGGVPVFAEADN